MSQDYRPLEIDVSDDSPNDDSEKVLGLIQPPNGVTLRYRRNVPALGEPENVNSLFNDARGKYLVLIHDDDILLKHALTTLWKALRLTPGAVAAFGMQEIIRNSGELHSEYTIENSVSYRREAKYAGVVDPLCSALLRQFPNNGYLINTKAARAILYRSRLDIGGAGDTDFAIRLGQSFPGRSFVFVGRPVSQCRLTLNNASSTMTEMSSKLYRYVLKLQDLNDSEKEAQRHLLQALCHQVVSEHAIRGDRLGALQILVSKYYARSSRPLRTVYHIALIIFPLLQHIRALIRKLSG